MENSEEISQNGVEFLKKLGIKEVSNRTFIHETELNKFLNGDFHGINKTKAMGFIQILEREFSIDLSDLKGQYVAYLNEHIQEEEKPKQSLMMEEVQNEERKKGFFSFLFLIAAIGSIAYLIDKYDLLNFSNPGDIKTAQVINSEEVKNAKLNLEKLSQPKKPKIVEKVTKEENILASEITNTQKSESDLLKNDESSSNEANNNIEENNNNMDSTDLDLSKLNDDLKDETNQNDVVNNDLLKDENSDLNNTNDTAISNEIYIIPNSKVWIGTIELDTLKKKDFLAPRGKRVDIDGTTNKLIMIGHKFVKMYFNGEKVKFKRKGPIRFKYIDGVLTEISRSEFNKLAKGRQW